MKRVVDIAVSGAALAAATPLMLCVAALVRIDLGSPVLFRQPRAGRGGTPFTLLKFRTMRDRLDSDGNSLPDSERLTPVGRFLRSTSIDELPQLWNILRGDMSLIGPRPLLLDYLPCYSRQQARRHEVLPGITGWAQVNGRNATSWDERFALDVWYVDHRSLAVPSITAALRKPRL